MPVSIHEAANIFPVEEETIAELAEDISQHGLQSPVQLLDGKVIDGRRRLAACKIAGVEAQFSDIETDDPVAYVLSLNLHRRHLTPSQRAMVGARVREIYDRQAKERQQASGGDRKSEKAKSVVEKIPQPIDHSKARDAVGKAVGVNGKYVDYATKVIKSAVPAVVKAVDEGRMAVDTAAILATEPPDVQEAEAANPKRRRTYNSVSSPLTDEDPEKPQSTRRDEPSNAKVRGVGVVLANEAINCLIRIPKNDALRQRGFQVVTDWIKANK